MSTRPCVSRHTRRASTHGRALWIKLAEAGIIANGSDSALDAWVRKQIRRKVSSARFLIDPEVGSKVIEALKAMAKRADG